MDIAGYVGPAIKETSQKIHLRRPKLGKLSSSIVTTVQKRRTVLNAQHFTCKCGGAPWKDASTKALSITRQNCLLLVDLGFWLDMAAMLCNRCLIGRAASGGKVLLQQQAAPPGYRFAIQILSPDCQSWTSYLQGSVLLYDCG